MLPENYELPKRTKSQFAPLPIDTYEAKITGMELLKDVPNFKDKSIVEDKLKFEFTIEDDTKFPGLEPGKIETTKGRKVWFESRMIMNAGWNGGQPSWLYKIFCAAFGTTLTDEETKGISAGSINELVGRRIRILVQQNPGKSDPTVIYNKITAVLPSKFQPDFLTDEMPKPQTNDWAAGEPDPEIKVEDIPF